MLESPVRMKQSKKEIRTLEVLFGLVELFLETGTPVGSQTLKEHGFEHLSSATLRNYFAELETKGLLHQSHASGGRIPTPAGLRLYALAQENSQAGLPGIESLVKELSHLLDGKGIHTFLQHMADRLSVLTGMATFLSSVRFDHDFIADLRLIALESDRLLCVLITDFGQILTEILSLHEKVSFVTLHRIERYLQWRIRGGEAPSPLADEEELLAKGWYDEIMVRYLVRYANFSEEEIYRTGFSHLLHYPEFSDPMALSAGLALFENQAQMRLLLHDCVRRGQLSYWIGEDLAPYTMAGSGCSILAIPYRIGGTIAGAIGLLGPTRIPYKLLFGTLRLFAEQLSVSLTKTLSTFKLSFRQPRTQGQQLPLAYLKPSRHYLEMKDFPHANS